MLKRVTRTIVIEGEAGWVDSVLSASALRMSGEQGVKTVRPGCTMRCTFLKTETQEIPGLSPWVFEEKEKP